MQLPDLRQKDGHSCGAIATRIAAQALGVRYGNDIAERLLTTDTDGTDPRNIESFLRSDGFGVTSGNMCVADLKFHVRQGRPVICLITDGCGHYVVVGEVSRGRVRFADPVNGLRSTKVEDFVESWWDVSYLGAAYHQWGLAVWRQ